MPRTVRMPALVALLVLLVNVPAARADHNCGDLTVTGGGGLQEPCRALPVHVCASLPCDVQDGVCRMLGDDMQGGVANCAVRAMRHLPVTGNVVCMVFDQPPWEWLSECFFIIQ